MKIKRGKHIKTNSGSQKLVKRISGADYTVYKTEENLFEFCKKQTTDPTKELRLLMYSDIDAMPMLKFMDCICDNNLNSLYKDPHKYQMKTKETKNSKIKSLMIYI